MQRITLSLLVASAFVALSACGGGSSGDGPAATEPAIEPKWSVIFPQIIAGQSGTAGSCALSNSCHQGSNATGVLRLDGDKTTVLMRLVNQTSSEDGPPSGAQTDKLIVPGDPDHSFFYKKITGDLSGFDCNNLPQIPDPTNSSKMISACGVQMPQGGPYLHPNAITAIHDWIAAGAQDN